MSLLENASQSANLHLVLFRPDDSVNHRVHTPDELHVAAFLAGFCKARSL